MRILRRQDPRLPIARGIGSVPIDVRGPDPGPVRIQPSQPGAYGPEQGIYIRLPGMNYPPAGATPVDQDGDANIAPGGTATMVSIQVPDGQRFRMVGIGFGADDETSLRFLTWSIQFDQVPQSGYTAKNAVIGSIVQLTDIVISAGSSATVSVVGIASPLAVLTYRYICRFRGYFYAETTGTA